jgi:hypothetical protein
MRTLASGQALLPDASFASLMDQESSQQIFEAIEAFLNELFE